MADITWVTPRGKIATIAEAEYFEYQLTATDATASIIRYTLVSGDLPFGLQINETTGLLSGVAAVTRKDDRNSYQFDFTVRAFNDLGSINDRRFQLVVGGIIPIKIVPRDENLGAYYDGLTYSRQLLAVEFDPTNDAVWSVVRGTLPKGLKLSSRGILSGYLDPIVDVTAGSPGWDNTSWDTQTWDFFGRYVSKTYEFLVQVSDGHSIDRINYSFTVVARPYYTADNSLESVNQSSLTIDNIGRHEPVMLTPPGTLPSIRQQTKYLYKFEAVDFDGDPIEYRLTSINRNFSNTGLTLDPATGWLTGTIARQASDLIDYKFQIYAVKRDEPGFSSRPVTFTLNIFGDLTNIVVWDTDENLGVIDNGEVSTFSVRAFSPSGKTLYYARKDGDPGHLPPGLKLLPSGLISGQVSFQYFTLDHELEVPTTFDNGATVFDTVYKVNIVARDYANDLESAKTFVIKVNTINPVPYQNLYLNALPSLEQRENFNSIINNTQLFPSELLFRFDDPYFGRTNKMRSLFAAGLTPSELSEYAQAAQKNHYDKRLFFGQIKTAQALDQNFKPLYEVVYVELVDQQTTWQDSKLLGPALETDLSGIIENPYYTETGQQLRKLEPNSFTNMVQRVGDQIDYINRGAYPAWMLSRQRNGTVLGLVNAIVLAYTVPGAADLIAFRLKSQNIDFGPIDFVADRYELDTRATTNFDIADQEFETEPETVFDSSLRMAEKTIVGSVDYAVVVPFDEINDRSKFYSQVNGHFDGVIDFKDGETLIFAKQQNYTGYTGSNNGWFRTISVDGSPILEIIPGYTQKLSNQNLDNQRAGIWRINLSSGTVMLDFVQEIEFNQALTVKKGNDFAGSVLYYDPVIPSGGTVPEYSVVSGQTLESKTIFDNNGTRFFSYRDNYTRPTDSAKYIKFPQFGAIK